MHTPLLTLDAPLTGNFSKIYYLGVNGFNDYVGYLYDLVYNHAVNNVVLRRSVALFIFMLFLSFIVGFIFFTRK